MEPGVLRIDFFLLEFFYDTEKAQSGRKKVFWERGQQMPKWRDWFLERAGTRFQVRGVNDFGRVANFAETEQVSTTTLRATPYKDINLTWYVAEVTYEFEISS